MDFGEWLRREREAKGLTRQQLAGVAGVSIAQIFNLETGRAKHPRRVTADKLKAAIDATRDPSCAFCGRREGETRWLVSSPRDESVAICDCCVRRVVALISNNVRQSEAAEAMLVLVRD